MTNDDDARPAPIGGGVRPGRSGERIVRVGEVDLCVQTFGEPTAPPILLVAGTACSMDWWEDGFCERLAAGPRFVVRYDHRDTGRSTSYAPGAPPYALRDLVADAIGLLDALGLARAHLVGMSMGGWIAQLAALDHADRVASLVLMSTRATPHGPGDPDLPDVSARLQALFAEEPQEPDWADRDAVIEHLVNGERPFAGTLPFDEAGRRAIAARVHDRTVSLASSLTNHTLIDGGDRWRERLGDLRVPTLVVHGTEDPLFPLGNARALAREIPDARLIVLEGVGHETPPRAVWDVVVPAILRHTSTDARRIRR